MPSLVFRKLARVATTAAKAATAAVGAATIVGFAGAIHWRFDLLAHFRLHYALALLPAIIVFAIARRTRSAVVATLIGALNLSLIAPLWLAHPGVPDPDATPISIVMHNANSANQRVGDVVEFLVAADADVIVVIESTPAMTTALAERLPHYEHIARPRTDPMGIAAFTRLPIQGARALDLAGGSVPELELVVRAGSRRVAILAIHALPPISASFYRERARVMRAAADWAGRQGDPHIVLGDFNATPWSEAMRELLEAGRLVDSQMGHGMQGTWPRGASPLTIPIDHVVHSRDLTTISRTTGPFLGSDHRSVSVTIAPRAGSTGGSRLAAPARSQ